MAIDLSKTKKMREEAKKLREESSFIGSGKLARKADTEVVVNQPLQVEDEFRSLYETQGGTNVVVEPPFNMLQLVVLCGRNNVLQQCIHAMEVNIDGTGHTIESVEQKVKSTKPAFDLLGEDGQKPGEAEEPGQAGKPVQPGEEGEVPGEEGKKKKPGDPAAVGEEGAEQNPGDPNQEGTFGQEATDQDGRPTKKPAKPGEPAADGEDAQADREAAPAKPGEKKPGQPVAEGEETEEELPLAPEAVEAEYAAWLEAEGKVVSEDERKRKRKELMLTSGDRSVENPTTEMKVQKFFGRNAGAEEDKPSSQQKKPDGSSFEPGATPFGKKKPPFGEEGVPGEEDETQDPEYKKADDFFKEPYPGMSMLTLRRLMRVDMEQTGNAYLEVVRNIKGEIMLLRHLPSYSMRLVRLDPDPIMVTKTIMRDGNEIEVDMPVRERRFVQKVGAKKYYYREFGASRDVNRDTGDWAKPDEVLDVKLKASEILYFKVDNDAGTPYGIPRWINNLPSVLGSRKAEEYNLEFFDAGGLPPALIIVEGGAMTSTVRDQLLQHMAGRGKTKHRAAVIEVQSTSGSLDRPGRVQVKVERFGDAKQSDSLFQGYDESCAEHVRRSFRMPPLFLGDSESFNFATASISYMVAEAQVFAPERKEFDDVINNTIMKELGITKFKFVSKPVTLKNVDLMLKGLEMGVDLITGEEKIDNINQITGLSLNYSAEVEKQNKEAEIQMMREKMMMNAGAPGGPPGKFGKPGGGFGKGPAEGGAEAPKPGIGAPTKGGFSMKADLSPNDIVMMVNKWCVATGLEEGNMGRRERNLVIEMVEGLEGPNKELFDRVMVTKNLSRVTLDLEGLSSISGQAMKKVRRDHNH